MLVRGAGDQAARPPNVRGNNIPMNQNSLSKIKGTRNIKVSRGDQHVPTVKIRRKPLTIKIVKSESLHSSGKSVDKIVAA